MKHPYPAIRVETLEDRVVPAAYITNGYLYILGTIYNDTASVRTVSSGGTLYFEVTLNNNVSYFATSSVTGNRIYFYGYDGNDIYQNRTAYEGWAVGGTGNDILIGGYRKDTLFGEDGNDLLLAGYAGADLVGGNGNDFLIGSEYADRAWGGDGNDFIAGGGGNDSLEGQSGNDLIFGGNGNDTIIGGAGGDILDGGAGNDRVSGETGNDILCGGIGNDSIWGGDGADVAFGGDGDDWLMMGAGNDLAYGNAGLDRMWGEDGNDALDGGAGNDIILGGTGNDLLSGNTGADTLYGQDGVDFLFGGDGNDSLYGGAGGDYLDGGYGSNKLFGEAGNDILYGSIWDSYNGGTGNDWKLPFRGWTWTKSLSLSTTLVPQTTGTTSTSWVTNLYNYRAPSTSSSSLGTSGLWNSLLDYNLNSVQQSGYGSTALAGFAPTGAFVDPSLRPTYGNMMATITGTGSLSNALRVAQNSGALAGL